MRWLEPTVLLAIVVVVAAGVGVSTRGRRSSEPAPQTRVTTGPAPAVAQTATTQSPAPPSGAPMAPRPLAEAHWQGIEVIPLTPKLSRELGRNAGLGRAPRSGVVIDQVTWPADAQGFAGGDVIVSLAGAPTPSLEAFVAATDRVRDRQQAVIRINRQGQAIALTMTTRRLGIANGETAPEIVPAAVPPHGCAAAHAALLHLDAIGPCEQCHPIRDPARPPTDLVAVLPEPKQTAPAGPINPLCAGTGAPVAR